MALIKTVVLFLTLLNGVLFLQAVLADEVAAPTATSHVVESKNSNGVTIGKDGYSHDDVVAAGDESLGSIHAEDNHSAADLLPDPGDIDVEEDADADLSDWSTSTEVDGKGEGEEEALSPAHPLARILAARSSKKCWSKKSCTKFFKKPGCCKKKCVNLAGDNKNCGKCGKSCKGGSTCVASKCVKPIPTPSQCGKHKKCGKGQTCCKGKCVRLSTDKKNCGQCGKLCDTKNGFSCKAGKCFKKPTSLQCGQTKCKPNQTCCQKKCVRLSTDSKNCGQCGQACDKKKGFVCKLGKCAKPAPTPSQCGLHKKCKSGSTCCKDKCVDLKGHNGHCGKCNNICGHGTACCQGTCKSIKSDDRNCGSCGKSCGFAKNCCLGQCLNVFGNDKNHCGACGKKCTTTCKFGMCGYGQ